jgi:nucleotide-binding universal stress UspA family protein
VSAFIWIALWSEEVIMSETQTIEPGIAPVERRYQVLACMDFSELGDRAVLEGLSLCSSRHAADLHVLTVAEEVGSAMLLPGPDKTVLPTAEAEEVTRRRVATLVDRFLNAGGRVFMERVAIYVDIGSVAERIISVAGAADVDLIVLGTHGRHGFHRVIGGSIAEEVMRSAPCGVFVIRPRDFLDGEKLPEVEPPLRAGEHSLRQMAHRHHYHYIDRVSEPSPRIMPAI